MYTSMKNMLKKANENNYAIMAINCFNMETARTVIRAAELEKAPIIINIFEYHMKNHCDSKMISLIVKELAERSTVEVCLNYDHGSNSHDLKEAIKNGYSSVMVDGSSKSYEENIEFTRDIVNFAKVFDVSVEAELGSISDINNLNKQTESNKYTDPDLARDFVNKTGIDALAISYGSAHGNYEAGYIPKFDFSLLKQIKEATEIPLVLHGGSGSGEYNIKKSVELGINKINVGTDFMNFMRQSLVNNLESDKSLDYFELVRRCEEESIEIIRKYIKLSGSSGRSI